MWIGHEMSGPLWRLFPQLARLLVFPFASGVYATMPEGPIRWPERGGGSEWEPIKILLQRENSAYAPNSQPRISTRVCQGRDVIMDLPTLGINPKWSQSESETQGAKDLAALRNPMRTVRDLRADRPRGTVDCPKNVPEHPVLHPQ
jgi:hypothetical protein